MPPRKRARVSQAPSPTPTSQAKTPTPAQSPSKDNEQRLNDPWTDEEEIGLCKGLIRCKPTGIHKHFHLLSLHQYMLENGCIHPRNGHTKPAGVWRKLHTLYDLSALDQREDARQLEKLELPPDADGEEGSDEDDDDDADVYSDAANKIENEDFTLAGADFDERKWFRRFADAKQRRDESPPELPELNLADKAPAKFTPSFSIEPEEVATPASKRGRGRAGTATSRPAKPAAAGAGAGAGAGAKAGTRRSGRQTESVADESEEQEVQSEDQEVEDGDGDEDEEQESAASTPATRSTRGVAPRGRPPNRAKARGRARGR